MTLSRGRVCGSHGCTTDPKPYLCFVEPPSACRISFKCCPCFLGLDSIGKLDSVLERLYFACIAANSAGGPFR